MKKNKDEQLALAGTEEAEILARLAERVEKAVATILDLRRERDALRKQIDDLESRLREQTTIDEEHERFRSERVEIRNRIETILESLEGLDGIED